MNLKKLIIGLLSGAVLTLCATAAQAAADPATAPVYAKKGELTCMKCHDKAPVADILKTPHAMKGDRTAKANAATKILSCLLALAAIMG